MRKKKNRQEEVLLVGLDSDLTKTLKTEFEKYFFDICEEKCPKKALNKVHEQEISVVIFDQEISPQESVDDVRKFYQSVSSPAIIVLVKNKSVKNIQGLYQAGAHDCLVKPFQISHFFYSIKHGLEKRKARIYGIKDPLTGLYNRYSFKDMLNSEIHRAQRYDRHLSLLMIDIDFFKRTNDRFGHIVGDRVLVELSEILKISLRKTDIITRFGGEEFAIILPETTVGHATILAERIRRRIENYDYSHLIGSESLTVSIGISNYHTAGLKNDITLIHSADQALYAAKKEGRNKVCISVTAAEFSMKSKRLTPSN